MTGTGGRERERVRVSERPWLYKAAEGVLVVLGLLCLTTVVYFGTTRDKTI